MGVRGYYSTSVTSKQRAHAHKSHYSPEKYYDQISGLDKLFSNIEIVILLRSIESLCQSFSELVALLYNYGILHFTNNRHSGETHFILDLKHALGPRGLFLESYVPVYL